MSKTMKVCLAIFVSAMIYCGIVETIEKSKAPPVKINRIGFGDGSTTGFGFARLGVVRPDASRIDALARKDAYDKSISESERAIYVRNWKVGFDMGWRSGK